MPTKRATRRRRSVKRATIDDDGDELRQRLWNLVPELFDLIKHYTLAIDTNKIITIGTNYRPPIHLQIDSTLRRTATRVFFSSNTFYIEGRHDNPWSWGAALQRSETYLRWRSSLSRQQRGVLENYGRVTISKTVWNPLAHFIHHEDGALCAWNGLGDTYERVEDIEKRLFR